MNWRLAAATELPTLSSEDRKKVESGNPAYVEYSSTSKIKGLKADEEYEAIAYSKDIKVSYNCTNWEFMRYEMMTHFVHICTLPLQECSFMVCIV